MSNDKEWQMHDHRRARRPQGDQRLLRSRDRLLGGVAAGVAEFVGAGHLVVRLLWIASLPLSGGITGLAYLLLWMMLPVVADNPERAGG